MLTRSLWQDTKTFFPLLLDQLTEPAGTVCVVGASDGKFVIPLAEHGHRVIAIERDRSAVNGGPVELPGHVTATMSGLRRRLAAEKLTDRVTIVEADLFDAVGLGECDAVWTSCSWHYSINHTRPLADYIDHLRALCRPGGLLAAEFMMPIKPRHHDLEHYLAEGEIHRYLDGWDLIWETYTPAFTEAPHVEQLQPHRHRMGFVAARRPASRPPAKKGT